MLCGVSKWRLGDERHVCVLGAEHAGDHRCSCGETFGADGDLGAKYAETMFAPRPLTDRDDGAIAGLLGL